MSTNLKSWNQIKKYVRKIYNKLYISGVEALRLLQVISLPAGLRVDTDSNNKTVTTVDLLLCYLHRMKI